MVVIPEMQRKIISFFVKLFSWLVCLKAIALIQIKTKTIVVLMAKPKSPLTFLSPNFAITDVRPAKNIEANAYKIHVGIVKN